MGQNGDPDDCVRFGYLRGLNGGEVAFLESLNELNFSLFVDALMYFLIISIVVIIIPIKPAVKQLLSSELNKSG